MGTPLQGLKRFVFWDYPRAGWQYDVMVGVILIFIFFTPREWFRDQPKASSVAMIPSPEKGTSVFWIEPEQLAGVPEAEKAARASGLVRARTGKNPRIDRLEPIFDSEKEVKGYMAFTRP